MAAKNDTLRIPAVVVLLASAIACAIILIIEAGHHISGEYAYTGMAFVCDLIGVCFTVSYILISVSLVREQRKLMAPGITLAIVALSIRALFELFFLVDSVNNNGLVIGDSRYNYWESKYQFMTVLQMLVFVIGVAGIILLLLSVKKKDRVDRERLLKLSPILTGVSIIGTIVCGFWFAFTYFEISFGEFLTSYYRGESFLSFIGMIGLVLLAMMCSLESKGVPSESTVVLVDTTPNHTPSVTIEQNLAQKEMTSHAVNQYDEDIAIDMLKRFKQLLDLGIITQEEFDEKKQELLK